MPKKKKKKDPTEADRIRSLEKVAKAAKDLTYSPDLPSFAKRLLRLEEAVDNVVPLVKKEYDPNA